MLLLPGLEHRPLGNPARSESLFRLRYRIPKLIMTVEVRGEDNVTNVRGTELMFTLTGHVEGMEHMVNR
jgi:hypothetical protein